MKFLLTVALTTAIFMAWSNTANAGFGISPPWLKNSHLAPGSHYEQDIFLVQSKPDKDVKITVTVESAEQIASWISFQPGTEFVIPAGKQQFPVRVAVNVPKDAGYTTYTGKIRFVASSSGSGGGNIAIQLGALADISLTVTSEEFSDFKVKHVGIDDLEEGWPIKIRVKLENLGNIKVRPTRIVLKIYDKWHDKLLQEGEPQTVDWVDAFATGNIEAAMETSLGISDYFGDFEIFKGEEVIAKDKQRFHIVGKGALERWPRIFGISIAWIGGGFGALLGVVAIIKFNILGKILGKLGIEVIRKRSNPLNYTKKKLKNTKPTARRPEVISDPMPQIGFRPVATAVSMRKTRRIRKSAVIIAKAEPKKRGRPRKTTAI